MKLWNMFATWWAKEYNKRSKYDRDSWVAGTAALSVLAIAVLAGIIALLFFWTLITAVILVVAGAITAGVVALIVGLKAQAQKSRDNY